MFHVDGRVFNFRTGLIDEGGFRFFQNHIRKPLDLEREHAEFIQAVNQSGDACLELFLISDEGKQHADAEFAAQNEHCASPDHSYRLQAKNQPICSSEKQSELFRGHLGVGGVSQQVHPARLSAILAAQDFDGANAAERLNQMGLLFGETHDLLFRRPTQWTVGEVTQQDINQYAGDNDQSQLAAIEEHYGQNKDRDQAIEQRFNEVIGQSSLNGFSAVKAGKNVAEVALLKERNRQPYQMGEKIGIPLQFEQRAEIKSCPTA